MRKIILMYGIVNISICFTGLINPIYPILITILTLFLFLLITSCTDSNGKQIKVKPKIHQYRIIEIMDKFIIEMYGYNNMMNPWSKGWCYIGTHNTLEEAEKYIKLLNKKPIIHETY